MLAKLKTLQILSDQILTEILSMYSNSLFAYLLISLAFSIMCHGVMQMEKIIQNFDESEVDCTYLFLLFF